MMKSRSKKTEMSEYSCSIHVESRSRIQLRQKSRSERIRDRNVVYPMSSREKIVFISNRYGNGFRGEPIEEFEVPSHIPVDGMLGEVNRACYLQWKNFHDELDRKPLAKLELGVKLVCLVALLLMVIYLELVNNRQSSGFAVCNYIICALTLIVLGMGTASCLASKEVERPDGKMVTVIQEKLIEFNEREQEYYPDSPRFQWSCHSQCLWIAISF